MTERPARRRRHAPLARIWSPWLWPRLSCRPAPGLAACRLAGLVAGMAPALSGCWQTEGGLGFSTDQFTFESTEFRPTTLILRDVRDGSEVWSLDIPVGAKGVVEFDSDKYDDPARPDRMKWVVVPPGEMYEPLRNELRVPDLGSRRLEVRLREGPELALGAAPQPISPPPPGGGAESRRAERGPATSPPPRQRPPPPRPGLEVGPDGAVAISGANLHRSGLPGRLATLHQADPTLEIVVRGTEGASYTEVSRVIDMVRSAGFERVLWDIGGPTSGPPGPPR